MKQAEMSAAGMIALFSIYLMVKSAELPIGWVEYQGPGGGAFPFWLSAIMLVTAIGILVRAWRGQTAPSQSSHPFIHPGVAPLMAAIVASLFALLIGVQIVGVYVAVPLFLLFYLRILGRHSWRVTLPMVLLTPVVLFFLFDVTLRILLPKGITEPLFFPLYAIFM